MLKFKLGNDLRAAGALSLSDKLGLPLSTCQKRTGFPHPRVVRLNITPEVRLQPHWFNFLTVTWSACRFFSYGQATVHSLHDDLYFRWPNYLSFLHSSLPLTVPLSCLFRTCRLAQKCKPPCLTYAKRQSQYPQIPGFLSTLTLESMLGFGDESCDLLLLLLACSSRFWYSDNLFDNNLPDFRIIWMK